MAMGMQILREVNAWSGRSRQELLTDRLGEEKGKRVRSYFFCFDCIWAFVYNVSFNKNDVARRIIEHIDVEALRTSAAVGELRTFSENLERLKEKFSRHTPFEQGNALTTLIDELRRAIPGGNAHNAPPEELHRVIPGGNAHNAPSSAPPPSTRMLRLEDFVRDEYPAVFDENLSGSAEQRKQHVSRRNGWNSVASSFPNILPTRGDGSCAYRALSILKYVQGSSSGNLQDFQEQFVAQKREEVANFLSTPAGLGKIPPDILNHNLPENIDMARFCREAKIPPQDGRNQMINMYGGITRQEMINAIRGGERRNAASPLELWILGYLEEQAAGQEGRQGGFINILYDRSSLETTSILYPQGPHSERLLLANEREVVQEAPPLEGQFAEIGALMDLDLGHTHCVLSEDAARHIRRYNTIEE